jgi:hypothetical protein
LITGGVTVIFPFITPSKLVFNSYLKRKEVKGTTIRAGKTIMNSL